MPRSRSLQLPGPCAPVVLAIVLHFSGTHPMAPRSIPYYVGVHLSGRLLLTHCLDFSFPPGPIEWLPPYIAPLLSSRFPAARFQRPSPLFHSLLPVCLRCCCTRRQPHWLKQWQQNFLCFRS